MIRIREFQLSDVEFALTQTAREGWDCTAELFHLCLAHEPKGCFIAEVDGRAAGMVTSTRYARSAWIGNLIITPDQRRCGLGQRLMEHVLTLLENAGVTTVHLEADPMGIGIYRRLGFKDRFESLRFRKTPPHKVSARADDSLVATKLTAPLAAHDLAEMQRLDALSVADERGRLLERYASMAPAGYVVRNERGLVGFALTWPSAFGVRFGPCVSADPAAAESLLDAALADFPDKTVILGVPAVNRAAIALYEARGFARTPPCLRMTRGPLPDADKPEMIHAITNGCLG